MEQSAQDKTQTCKVCGRVGTVDALFGVRVADGVTRPHDVCRYCRESPPEELKRKLPGST